ncbi:GNAT family N-acetyltransferase [Mucilaginibacter sp. OK098]|uniref:GNAT family N-acetyltransferase n=1 Tax=Mucilaginibacter sp. OK098 TaxID=1855297 RepID=UPI00091C740D|nr:GNAT family N-acetyltransferase [Mucilaginibacter sp. OK098]SHM68984.1 ribosomal-protein-alanine N-acetyltransferase [Mucilaginibacter sp. OK098]
MNIITQTPRIIIRLFEPEEEEMYLSLYNDERVMLYLPFRSREEHIKIFREHLVTGPVGSVTGRWGLFNKADNDFIGMCLLRLFDDGSDSIELGYALHYNHWGKGVASEMADALLTHMRNINQAAKFVAVTDLGNIPSQRVLEKAGMKRDGNYFRNGEELAFFRSLI